MSRADLDAQRALFEVAMKAARFFPAEIRFIRKKSPSGRDEYANSHLESCWIGWQAALAAQAPVQGEPVASDAEDAARYRFLRKGFGAFGPDVDLHNAFVDGDEKMDAAIDAARKAGT